MREMSRSRRGALPRRRRLPLALAALTVPILIVSACGGPASEGAAGRKAARGHAAAPAPSAATPSASRRGLRVRLWSLRGRIAYSRGGDIWVARADGRDARRLTATRGPQFDPSWSPDGSRIVYRDSRRGINVNDEIYVMNADGTHRRNLTRSPWNEWSPAWSPDGRLIAFYSGELYVMRADGTGKRPITRIEGEYPAWSPDGRRLAFMSPEPGARGRDPNYDIFVVDRDGGGLRRLTDWPGEDGWPAWSPDGRWIAFTTSHDDHGQFPGLDYRDVYVMRPDGSGKRRLVSAISAAFPVWAPDGRTVMVVGERPPSYRDELWVVRPDGSGLRSTGLGGWLPDWTRC